MLFNYSVTKPGYRKLAIASRTEQLRRGYLPTTGSRFINPGLSYALPCGIGRHYHQDKGTYSNVIKKGLEFRNAIKKGI